MPRHESRYHISCTTKKRGGGGGYWQYYQHVHVQCLFHNHDRIKHIYHYKVLMTLWVEIDLQLKKKIILCGDLEKDACNAPKSMNYEIQCEYIYIYTNLTWLFFSTRHLCQLPNSFRGECWVDICWRDTNFLTAISHTPWERSMFKTLVLNC